MKKITMALILSLVLVISAEAASISYPPGYVPYYHEQTAVAMAKLMWAEGRGIPSDTEKAAIIWCVINRVEREGCWSDDIMAVIQQPNQFAYSSRYPLDPGLYELAKDVLIRWDMERCGYEDVGRVLPAEYCYFSGDGWRNIFRTSYRGGTRWDWSLASPYAS